MNIYHFHPEICEYQGSGEARQSPLEDDVYLVPAHATEAAPPSQSEGFARVFVDAE